MVQFCTEYSSEIHSRPLDYIVVDHMALLEVGATIALTRVTGVGGKHSLGN